VKSPKGNNRSNNLFVKTVKLNDLITAENLGSPLIEKPELEEASPYLKN
jgi:hypothetical protein